MNTTTNSEKNSYYINKYSNYYNDIMSKMCHEINNSLTLINSTIQIIERDYIQIKDIRYWEHLKYDVEDCVELLDNFKKSQNCISTDIKNDNLLELIESVVKSFLPITENNGLSLTLTVEDNSKPYYINYPFDKVGIKRVLINLIKNAIESTEPGDYINVYCSSDDINIIIEIKDNGTPISEEIKDEIFTPHITNKASGSGLGMPICKSIILYHMGDIDINSDGNETSFIISLPVSPVVQGTYFI